MSSDQFWSINSVFIITDENNSSSISIPFKWRVRKSLEDGIVDKLKKLLKLKSENDIELHVNELGKRDNKIEMNSNEFALSDFDSSKTKYLKS